MAIAQILALTGKLNTWATALSGSSTLAVLRAIGVVNPSNLILNTMIRVAFPRLVKNFPQLLKLLDTKKVILSSKSPFLTALRRLGENNEKFNKILNKRVISAFVQTPNKYLQLQTNQILGDVLNAAIKKVTGKSVIEMSNGAVKKVDMNTIYRFFNNKTQQGKKIFISQIKKRLATLFKNWLLSMKWVPVNSSWLKDIYYIPYNPKLPTAKRVLLTAKELRDMNYGMMWVIINKGGKITPRKYGGIIGYQGVKISMIEEMANSPRNAGTIYWRKYWRNRLNKYKRFLRNEKKRNRNIRKKEIKERIRKNKAERITKKGIAQRGKNERLEKKYEAGIKKRSTQSQKTFEKAFKSGNFQTISQIKDKTTKLQNVWKNRRLSIKKQIQKSGLKLTEQQQARIYGIVKSTKIGLAFRKHKKVTFLKTIGKSGLKRTMGYRKPTKEQIRLKRKMNLKK